MVDSGNDNREDFVINKNDAEEEAEAEDFHREGYYANSTDIFRKRSALPFIIGGVGLIVLVLIFGIILSGRNNGADREELQSLETRIEQLEKKLATTGAMDQTLEQLERQEQGLSAMGERFKVFESTVNTQIDQIIKELGALHQKLDRSPIAKAQASPPAEKKATAAAQKKAAATEIYQVKAGDTLFRISRRFGLTVEQLRSYNNIAPDAAIHPGQKLKLQPNGKQ
jgi:LysM repeat protein